LSPDHGLIEAAIADAARHGQLPIGLVRRQAGAVNTTLARLVHEPVS
jgi:hypothetical protein